MLRAILEIIYIYIYIYIYIVCVCVCVCVCIKMYLTLNNQQESICHKSKANQTKRIEKKLDDYCTKMLRTILEIIFYFYIYIYIYIYMYVCMYKLDLELNNLQWLIWHKTKPTKQTNQTLRKSFNQNEVVWLLCGPVKTQTESLKSF